MFPAYISSFRSYRSCVQLSSVYVCVGVCAYVLAMIPFILGFCFWNCSVCVMFAGLLCWFSDRMGKLSTDTHHLQIRSNQHQKCWVRVCVPNCSCCCCCCAIAEQQRFDSILWFVLHASSTVILSMVAASQRHSTAINCGFPLGRKFVRKTANNTHTHSLV